MPRRERENTLPSFAAALAAGAQGIELDAHATADGVVVVHHDAATGDGVEIARALWSDLSPSRRRSGATEIPTLASVCDLVAERAELFVEIKGEGIEEAVDDAVGLLAEYGARDAWPHRSLIDQPLVERIQRSGGRVIAWTVNSASEARRLAGYGIDGICTDDVTLLDAL